MIPGSAKSEPPKAGTEGAGADSLVADADANNGAAPPRAGRKPSLVDQAKGTFEEWQHKIDERVKAVVPNILPWQQLQHEVKRLNARIEELEEKLKSLTPKE